MNTTNRQMPLRAHGLVVDAGVCHCRVQGRDRDGAVLFDLLFPSNADLRGLLAAIELPAHTAGAPEPPLLITGRFAPWVRKALGRGRVILPAAAAWLTARDLLRAGDERPLGLIELSASGYLLAGVEGDGELRDDLLLTHPRCGAGSGVNLDRILQKLGLARDQVDVLLADYLGEAGAKRRAKITTRADRCGVFSASATVSDKNQGIPLAVALATTLKSEVLKACRKLPPGYDTVLLTGRLFLWRYARDCAEDQLRAQGVSEIDFDPHNDRQIEALWAFARRVSMERIAAPDRRLLPDAVVHERPAFETLKVRLQDTHAFQRLPESGTPIGDRGELAGRRLDIGLDVGSTMAKIVLADADSGEALFHGSYSNAGDTIETLKRVFRELIAGGADVLRVHGIGITGSARYQVKEALAHLYPQLAERLFVLVENYAHARGSIALAREHVERIAALGLPVERELCILVDVGGEDTKISTIALAQAELYGNAMNLKCSAGTGSLMDTLAALFELPDVACACREAQAAARGLSLDATCAVFLMEHARRLQVQGVPQAEILASAVWAIVENMAHGLWPQLDLPRHAVVLLHGQTMRSDPLPLAVVQRLAAHLEAPVYGLVPPHPGHRACFGLIHTLRQVAPAGDATLPLAPFVEARFEKRIIECRGAACDDPDARCNRAHLSCRRGEGERKLSFTLGGCSAINELLAHKLAGDGERVRVQAVPDSYKALWDYVDERLPKSEAPDRLVIARSFVVSEWAFLLGHLLQTLGLPVHVDDVRAEDLTDAQPLFNIDTCAPHMGAVGQYRRLAGQPHGMILAPQIEYLPTDGVSRGLACTLNQGGVAVAANLATLAHGAARFHLFHLDLGRLDTEPLLEQLVTRLSPVFEHYGIAPMRETLAAAITDAVAAHRRLRTEVADLAARHASEALDEGRQVALVVGREYILNPGIYDSHVRRLLRDQNLTVIPSWVLDVALDPDYRDIYWRNPHFILTLLDGVARRELHRRIRHAGLRGVFERIETGAALLPVVQVSTFSCGPDSIIRPMVAEIMRRRPFLLIQSDAVLKELAHLENRVNTYMKQLAPDLRLQRTASDTAHFSVRTLDELDLHDPVNADTDVIYFPTLADNRSLTAVLRGAGFTCIDNYDDDDFDLARRVHDGRRTTGDAVCAPLAAVYGDLECAIADFTRRRAQDDPLVAGKKRLLYFEIKGTGPCRQGLYTNVHQVLFQRGPRAEGRACNALPGDGVLKMLAGREYEGFNFGMPEWVLVRAHQGTILQGVLHALLFAAAGECADYAGFERFQREFRALKEELYRRIERHARPRRMTRAALAVADRLGTPGALLKFLIYRAGSRPLLAPLRAFARRWLKRADGERLHILLTGEIYMRVSQAEAIHRALLGHLGFRRFTLGYTPAWGYLEYALDEDSELARERMARAAESTHADGKNIMREQRRRIRRNEFLRLLMRRGLAAPLYNAVGLTMPPTSRRLLDAARAVLPTLRPLGELLTYAGETLHELGRGADLVFNVAPNGCMVSSMGEVLTPRLVETAGRGRIQHLFSADGSVDVDLLALALLKAMGPEGYYRNAEATVGTDDTAAPSSTTITPDRVT